MIAGAASAGAVGAIVLGVPPAEALPAAGLIIPLLAFRWVMNRDVERTERELERM